MLIIFIVLLFADTPVQYILKLGNIESTKCNYLPDCYENQSLYW